MKVKDLIRLTDDRTEVMIYELNMCQVIDEDSECCNCWGEDCIGCPYYKKELTDFERYCGTAEQVPIKLSEVTIKSVGVRRRIIKQRKVNPLTSDYLAIQVKA